LTWTGEKPEQGIQEQAREARYRLLGAYARSCGEGRCAVVTAHTREDQAETLLMRLARGSGPDGLQGMPVVRSLSGFDGVDVVRPLLGIGRAAMRSFLEARGISWIDDPSNEDRRFERVRLRAVADELAGIGLTPRMLSLAAMRQRRAVAALEAATDALQAAAVDLNGGMFAAINMAAWLAAPEDIRVRLTGRVLSAFGGASPPADLAQVERLAAALSSGGATRQTLGGCDVRACRKVIRVFRERGRADLADIRLRPGEATTWDNRFHISVARAEGPVTVRALDASTMAGLRETFHVALPARAAATLPAVWAGDELVSVGGLPDHLFWPSGERAGASVQTRFVLSPSQTLP
jgi:tRNA(Ile)-lysidine synthase